MSVDVEGGADQERCIPIPLRIGIRPETSETRQTDISMVVGLQQTGDRPMAACTQYPSDDLYIGVIHPSQRKTRKRQQTENILMAASSRFADFSPRVETDFYLKRAHQMGKSLIIASTQRTNFDIMVVSQWTTMLRVVAKQQTNTYPQVISVQ